MQLKTTPKRSPRYNAWTFSYEEEPMPSPTLQYLAFGGGHGLVIFKTGKSKRTVRGTYFDAVPLKNATDKTFGPIRDFLMSSMEFRQYGRILPRAPRSPNLIYSEPISEEDINGKMAAWFRNNPPKLPKQFQAVQEEEPLLAVKIEKQ